MFAMAQHPSTWLICVAAATINVSDHQHEATLSCDEQGHALLTVPLLLQDLPRGTYFQFLSGTPNCILLFVVNSKLTNFSTPDWLPYLCSLRCVYSVLSVRRCWAPVDWRHSKLLWWWWWWWWWWRQSSELTFKFIDFCCNWKPTHDFLLVINCRLSSILHCLRDIASRSSSPPHPNLSPWSRGPSSNFAIKLGRQRVQALGYILVKTAWS